MEKIEEWHIAEDQQALIRSVLHHGRQMTPFMVEAAAEAIAAEKVAQELAEQTVDLDALAAAVIKECINFYRDMVLLAWERLEEFPSYSKILALKSWFQAAHYPEDAICIKHDREGTSISMVIGGKLFARGFGYHTLIKNTMNEMYGPFGTKKNV